MLSCDAKMELLSLETDSLLTELHDNAMPSCPAIHHYRPCHVVKEYEIIEKRPV